MQMFDAHDPNLLLSFEIEHIFGIIMNHEWSKINKREKFNQLVEIKFGQFSQTISLQFHS